jgi:hypothetical protein
MNSQDVLKRFAIAFFLLMSLQTQANEKLLPFEAKLEATRFGTIDFHLDGKMYFRMDGNQWQYGLVAEKGAISTIETSQGTLVNNNTYRPSSYDKKSQVFLIKENIEWNFDWANMVINGKVKKDSYKYPLNENIFDPLSYHLAMRQHFRAGNLEFTFKNLNYRRPETFNFVIIGEELLELNGRTVLTKIVKQMAPVKKDYKHLIWIAPEYDFIPVKFASYKKGKLKDLIEVTSLTMDASKASF